MEINSFGRASSLGRMKRNKSANGHLAMFILRNGWLYGCFPVLYQIIWYKSQVDSFCSADAVQNKPFSHNSLKSTKRRSWTFQNTKELFKRFIGTKMATINVKYNELSFLSWGCWYRSITRSWAGRWFTVKPLRFLYCQNKTVHADYCHFGSNEPFEEFFWCFEKFRVFSLQFWRN